jgi:hypothetical protein
VRAGQHRKLDIYSPIAGELMVQREGGHVVGGGKLDRPRVGLIERMAVDFV